MNRKYVLFPCSCHANQTHFHLNGFAPRLDRSFRNRGERELGNGLLVSHYSSYSYQLLKLAKTFEVYATACGGHFWILLLSPGKTRTRFAESWLSREFSSILSYYYLYHQPGPKERKLSTALKSRRECMRVSGQTRASLFRPYRAIFFYAHFKMAAIFKTFSTKREHSS